MNRILLLLLLFFCLRAHSLFCDRVHGGFCCEDGSCICESPYSGDRCAQIDYCREKDCSGHGKCNRDNGLCECESQFIGPNCEWMDCGNDGVYQPITKSCSCISGYSGPGCKHCLIRPEGHNLKRRYICCPANWDAARQLFILLSVIEEDMYKYVSGVNGFPYCTFPNTTMRNGDYLDCACRMHLHTTKKHTAPSHNVTESPPPAIVQSSSAPIEEPSQRLSHLQAFYSTEIGKVASYVSAYNNPLLLTQVVEQLQSLKSFSSQASSETLPNNSSILLFVVIIFIALALLVAFVFVFGSLARTPSTTQIKSSFEGVSSSGTVDINSHYAPTRVQKKFTHAQ